MAETAEVIDVEAHEMLPATTPVGQVSIYRSQEPEDQLAEAQARARVLVTVVREQGLAKKFRGDREHVQVEGWTFLASQFGLVPDIEWTKELPDGWEARAALRRLSDGQVITHAESECRRSESNWKDRDSYAIRSMASTRAVSKVCRIALSSVMVMAGFSATPAEEMDSVGGGERGGGATTASDPHCPACMAINGEIVGLYQNDNKPFWRCKNKQCAGTTEKNGRKFVWAGWHETWEASRDEWFENNPQHAGPQSKDVSGRNKSRWKYIMGELLSVGGVEGDRAKQVAKVALITAIGEGDVDLADALGVPVEPGSGVADLDDAQLVTVAANLTAAEADSVVAHALTFLDPGPDGQEGVEDAERPF